MMVRLHLLQASCTEQEGTIAEAQAVSEALLLDMVAQTRAVGEQEQEVRCCRILLHAAATQ